MRRIGDKFHIEGDRIIKTSNGEAIPDEEPVFLLRARDYLTVRLLHKLLEMSIEDGCTDYQLDGLRSAILEFSAFARRYPERMKQPGITRGR